MSAVSRPPARKLLWTGTLPPHQGGSAVSGFQLLVALAALGHTIRSLTPVTPQTADAARCFDEGHPALNVTRFEVPYGETSPDTPAPDSYREMEQAQVERGLMSLISRERPDILIMGRETFAWRAPSVAEVHAVPCMLRLAGGFLAGVLEGRYPPALVSRWLEQVRKVDVVIAQTESLAASIETLGVSRIRLIPNAVDLQRFAPAPKDDRLSRELELHDRIVVMHVSNLKPLKRALDVVESAVAAVKHDPRLVYVIVGDGADRSAMEAACRRHGITHHFRFIGWVPYDRIPTYLNLADVVVMPSEFEAQARVYLETQACGRTLVASDIAAARHVIVDGRTGLLFRRGDVADLTQTTLRAAADADLRAGLGARARERVLAHSLDDVAGAYANAVEDVISRRAARAGRAHRGRLRSQRTPVRPDRNGRRR